jgi:hypothetical protein
MKPSLKGRTKMRKIKSIAAITLLAAIMSLNVPQAFAGQMDMPLTFDGPQESPGLTSILFDLAGVLISD